MTSPDPSVVADQPSAGRNRLVLIVYTAAIFVSALLLFSGATPAVDERLAYLDRFLPLAVLEVSHLAGSIVGLGLLVLARALFRRVQAAYHICVWLLVAGISASLLKGLDFEEAALLALVLGVLMLGRRAFYRPTAILSERFTPVWVVAIAGVILMAVWIGVISYRHVEYSHDLWWTFALDGNAPRMLRASLAVIVLGAAYVMWNMLRPARPTPARSSRSLMTDLQLTQVQVVGSAQHKAMSAPVQVFGRRHHERGRALRRPASKKRQGTKSRGGLGGGGQPALWGFDFCAGYGGRGEAGAKRPVQGVEGGLEARNKDLGGGVERVNGRSAR